ncbi:MAG: hypothetical protein V9G19_25620 [Tetrasphaera sp.]
MTTGELLRKLRDHPLTGKLLGPSLAWPPGEHSYPPLISTQVVFGVAGLTAFVCAIAWWSFAPAPNYLVLATVMIVGWVLAWIAGALVRGLTTHRWRPFRIGGGRQRGRDSRVSQLRALVRETADSDRADELHAIVTRIVADRLRTRGLDPARQPEEARALLGTDLAGYLNAPYGRRGRSPREIDQLLQRIERI